MNIGTESPSADEAQQRRKNDTNVADKQITKEAAKLTIPICFPCLKHIASHPELVRQCANSRTGPCGCCTNRNQTCDPVSTAHVSRTIHV